ncbi:DUF427 domain-containing protein [Candidatus Saccharibacteria bacterium]|nr:DUF427 domain-containing protein [Candidatus Saccharibacteria bacterium]
MKATWNEEIIAEANREDLVFIEGNWYFPPASVKLELLEKSPTPYTCPWKGKCQYFHIVVDGEKNENAAFCYPVPKPSALERIHKDFSGYVAFWRGVEVGE